MTINNLPPKFYPPTRTPRFSFSATLEVQEHELATNPLLTRMRESRAALAADPHRPYYHFVSPEGVHNDANGLCFWRGRWHLFYQGYPPDGDKRVHWGHAVSKDLVRWRDLPYALHPSPERLCFSGSTLVENDRVIAMYYGVEQGLMVATSSDPLLLNWEKLTNGPVVPLVASDGSALTYRVHDPCIWREGDTYYALSNGKDAWNPMDSVLQSKDLQHWEYLHPFVDDQSLLLDGDDGACPYFWPIGTSDESGAGVQRHILIFFSHMSGPQYLLGDYDAEGTKFHPTAHGKFNFGASMPSGVHAPSATPDGSGGIICIWNMNPGLPPKGWNQLMTLPRRLTLLGENKLGIDPAGEIETLRGAHVGLSRQRIPANEETLFEGLEGNAIELALEIDTGGAPMVALDVLRSPDRKEYTRIVFYRERGFKHPVLQPDTRDSLISIDSSHSSVLPEALSRAPETAPIELAPDETLKLRVFIDRSVVEVFANGRQCVAVRVYPTLPDSVGISLSAQGRDAQLISLDLWQTENIYAE